MEATSVDKFLDEHALGKKVIIRTYNAGVWFGELYYSCPLKRGVGNFVGYGL